MMPETLVRGALLRDIRVRTADGREAYVSDFRGRKNVVLFFPGDSRDSDAAGMKELAHDPALAQEEAVLLMADDAHARATYDAPKSALFIADRYGEIFFCVRYPDPLPEAAEVLKWLEFIGLQCPE